MRAFLTLFVVAGCSIDLEGRFCADGRCPEGYACGEDDLCWQACTVESDCSRRGRRCLDGLCRVIVPVESDGAVVDAELTEDAARDTGSDATDVGPRDAEEGDAPTLDGDTPDADPIDAGEMDTGVCDTPTTPWCSGATLVAGASVGIEHSCARLGDQSLWCWGGNEDGQLGLGNSGAGTEQLSPMQVAGTWIEIDSGLWHNCAVASTGALWCWGDNTYYKLGLADDAPRSFPTQIGGATDWFRAGAGRSHTCALRTNGTLWCWGQRQLGQAGQVTPIQIGARTDWERLSVENDHSCAITTGGALYCWGVNLYGELGQGDAVERPDPTRVGIQNGWTAAEAGWYFTCAVRSGELYCFGLNDEGQLGLGDTTNRDVPVRVGADADWRAVDTGYHHACALKNDDTLWCWGQNSFNELGLGAGSPANVLEPARVGAAANWSQIIVGDFHTCGIDSNGSLWCWGVGNDGRLGLGDDVNRDRPVDLCCP